MLRMPARMTLPAPAGSAVKAEVCDAMAPKTKRTKKTRAMAPGNRGL